VQLLVVQDVGGLHQKAYD